MPSKAVDILEALQGRLQRIKQSNGFYTTASSVTFGVAAPDHVKENYQLNIMPGDMPLHPLTNDCYSTKPPEGIGGWPIIILGYVRNETDGRHRLSLFDLQADVIKAINDDRRLNTTLVDDITIGDCQIWLDAYENVSFFMLQINLVYSFESTNP